MVKKDKEFLKLLKKQIQNYLCYREGIKDKKIEEFEKIFDEMKEGYPHLVGEMEAGAHENAPHHKQYLIAERLVKWLEDQMNLDDK